jgi:parvulin-like peptidyl-prolyl isomerase
MTNVVQMNEIEIVTNETAAVSNYALRIKEQLSVAATAWKEVAELFSSAANEFGLKSDAMRSLLKQTSFSESKAVKLIAIANSERLQENADAFKCVDAWTVLYAITTLKDDEFERLLAKVDAETVITQSIVSSVKDKTDSEVDNYKTVFTVQIDEAALKSQLFNEDDYNELMNAIQTIQDTMNYVRVQKTNRFENEVARFTDDVEKAMNKSIRQLFTQERKNSTVDEEAKASATEAMQERDYATAFDCLNSIALDLDEQRSEAQTTVRQKREEKFLDVANAYDACANTAIQTAA